MDKYLIFYASGVDSSSVTAHDSGTNVDLGCFNSSDISAIMGEEDMVYIYFRDSGRFEQGHVSATEVLEQSFVRLTVTEDKEIDVIKDLTAILKSTHDSNKTLLFDAVNDTWPIDNISAIQIRRHLTTHTIASD
jgi:spore coat polysaccharide biosynthesis protein SpsF (cytidylyltransferase family)